MARRFSTVVFAVMVVAALVQSSKAETHEVGDDLKWTVPSNGSVAYQNWAAGETFLVGDVLEFEFTTGAHDVAKVTKTAFDACNSTNPISHKTTGPANFTLDTSGEHYFICTVGTHCSLGQKLAVNVSAARAETEFIVGDSLGWTVPSGGAVTYQNWAANKTFVVGDSLKFNFTTGAHDVAEVTKAAFTACNGTNPISHETEGPADIDLETAGEHYFICTVGSHCSLGQKLAINVTTNSSTSPATPPSSSTTTPTSPSASGGPSQSPSGSTTPPSPGSAPSLAVAGLSATLLSVAAALLY